MIKVYRRDSGKELSAHKTDDEARRAIETFETGDRREGVFEDGQYYCVPCLGDEQAAPAAARH